MTEPRTGAGEDLPFFGTMRSFNPSRDELLQAILAIEAEAPDAARETEQRVTALREALDFRASVEFDNGYHGGDLLRAVAAWMDKVDARSGNANDQVQRDLRRWADKVDAALAAPSLAPTVTVLAAERIGQDAHAAGFREGYEKGRMHAALAVPSPAPTGTALDVRWLAMAMEIAETTPLLEVGKSRAEIVRDEYARLAAEPSVEAE